MDDMTIEQKAEAFDVIVAARRSHIDAVEAYNARLDLVKNERLRGNWHLNVDDEFAAVSRAQRELIRVVQDLSDTALLSEIAG